MTTPKIIYLQHGGKSMLAKWVRGYFPPHRIYVEPFFGSGAVLLGKTRSYIEVANDRDRSIVNVYRQAVERPDLLAAALRVCPFHQGHDFTADDDTLESAVMAIAESKQRFSGSRTSSTWRPGLSSGRPAPAQWGDWWRRVAPAVERLRGVCFHCEDAVKAIRRYANHDDALIYADPPYHGHENEYRESVDYQAMIAALVEARGFVVVSEYAGADAMWPGDWRVVVREMRTQRAGGGTKREILLLNPRAAEWNGL